MLILYFILLFCLKSVQCQAQSISYTPLTNYTFNPFFIVVNQTLHNAYNSYLSDSIVSSVYIYANPSLLSIVINYLTQQGVYYRATVNYIPSTRRLRVQSFGRPVVNNTSSSSSVPVIINNQPGSGITITSSNPNINYLLSGSNPNII
jgi:hypothetical protein